MATTTRPVRRIQTRARPGPIELVVEGLREIWSRRQLARYLVQADMIKHGANTVLGNIWWVLDPLLQMAVYVLFVAVILGKGGADYPLFVFAAILPWKWFSSSMSDAILSVTSREAIIRQVKFPAIVLPVAATASGVVSFLFGLIPLFAAINVFFRDLGNLERHLVRLWFYLSPALYATKDLDPAKYGILAELYKLNPWVVLFESYHDVIYAGPKGVPGPPDWAGLGILLLVSFIMIGFATFVFKRLEPAFAKVL